MKLKILFFKNWCASYATIPLSWFAIQYKQIIIYLSLYIYTPKAWFTMQEEVSFVKKCVDPRCGTCAYIEEGNKILKSGMEITGNSSMNCKFENVIYCAICPTCKQF